MSKVRFYIFSFIVVAVIVGVGLYSKVNKQPEQVKEVAAPVVNVYSSRKAELLEDMFEWFTVKTGIKVHLVTDKAPKLIERLLAEGDASPADVLLTSDVGNLVLAKEKGVLRPVSSLKLLENVPEAFRDKEGYWFGLSKRLRTIFYAKDRVDVSELSTYEDLASLKWKGKVLVRSSNNIYNQSLLASIIASKGEEAALAWAKGLVANFARKPQGGDTDQLKALALGQGDVAIANHYYYGRLFASRFVADREVTEKVGIFFPDQEGDGVHMNVSGGGITRHVKHPENALKLLEFLSGEDGQALYAEVNFEYPVHEGAYASQIVEAWGDDVVKNEGALRVFPSYLPRAVKMADEAGWR